MNGINCLREREKLYKGRRVFILGRYVHRFKFSSRRRDDSGKGESCRTHEQSRRCCQLDIKDQERDEVRRLCSSKIVKYS